MSSTRLSILAALIASGITALYLVFPTVGGAQAGGVEISLVNANFEIAGPGSSVVGWQGGRRVRDPSGLSGYVAEIRGPAGIMHQTISLAEAKTIVDLAKGRLTITFTIVSPPRNSGLIVSLGGTVLDAELYRSPGNPEKIVIQLDRYRLSRQGDRTLSLQVKRVGGRVLLDNIRLTYTPLGPDGSVIIDPTPTPNPAVFLPPGSLGQYPSVFPFATPTPKPSASLDPGSLRVSVNPPILYVAPATAGSGPGAARAAIRIELFKTDGTRMTTTEAEQRDAKVSFEFVGDDGAGTLSQEDQKGNIRSTQPSRLDLHDYLLGASDDEARQLYFVPQQIKDAEVRLMVRVELDKMPRTGVNPSTAQTQDFQDLELSAIVPISVRVARGVPAKGSRELEPLKRFNRIFVER